MSDKRYYFSEFSEDDVLYSLAQKAKDMLQDKNFVLKIYDSYKPALFGLSLKHISYLMNLNNVSVVSSSEQSFLSSPKHGRVSKRPEITNQVPSTAVKANPNVSTLQQQGLPFVNVGNEVSQRATKRPEKQSTTEKIIRSVTEPESFPQEHTSLISSEKRVPQTVSTNQRKQLISVKKNRNSPEPERLPSKHLHLCHKEINNAELVNLESRTPVRRQTVVVSPKKTDRSILNSITEVGREYVKIIAQDDETVGKPEADKQKPENSDEAIKVSTIFTAMVKDNLSLYEQVGVDGVPTTDGGKNTGPKEIATASDKRKSFGPAEEITQIIQTSKGEKKEFSLVKKVKISSNPATEDQKSVCFHNKAKMLVHSDQDSKKNITLNQRSNLFKNCERNRESPSSRTDTVQCSSMPGIIHSSGTVEIETDISFVSTQNPSPITSQISLIDYKSVKTITDNIDKEKSHKDITFSGNESKPGISRDISPLAKDSITSSPPVVENTNCPIRDDVIDLGKDRLFYKPSKRSPPKNRSAATLSSPRIKNMDSKTLLYCITQLKTLLSMREECLLNFFNCFSNFRYHLEYLCDYIQFIVTIVHNISVINADYVTEKLQINILRLITIASELVKQLGSWKTDIAIDIQYWVIYFQQIRKIISQNEPLVSNNKPLVTMEVLYAYEENIKIMWERVDKMMNIADFRRSLFLTTENDCQKSINLFIECLITVGILKPYSSPML